MLFRRIFAISSAALVLFNFTSCDRPVINDWPRMKLAKYRNALIHTPSVFLMFRLYFCAFMSMCVFFSLSLCDLLNPWLSIPASTLEIISARRSTSLKVLLPPLLSSRHARLPHISGAGKVQREQALSFHHFQWPPTRSQTAPSPLTEKTTLYPLQPGSLGWQYERVNKPNPSTPQVDLFHMYVPPPFCLFHSAILPKHILFTSMDRRRVWDSWPSSMINHPCNRSWTMPSGEPEFIRVFTISLS